MVKKIKLSLGEEGTAIIKGLLGFLLSSTVLILLSSLILTWKDIDEPIITTIICVVMAIASWLGGWLGGKSAEKQGFKIGTYIGGLAAMFVLSAGAIINGIHFTYLALVKLIICLLFGCFGGIIGRNASQKRKFKS